MLLGMAPSLLVASSPLTLPGKGLSFQEGQFAEYRSLVAVDGRTNEVMRTRFLVLKASPEFPELERVAVLSFAKDQLVKRQIMYYDPARAPEVKGELVDTEPDVIAVGKRKIDCKKEKRVSPNGTALTWTSTSVPVSGVVRTEISSEGKTLISELLRFGPEGMSAEEINAFMDAINPLKQSSPPQKQP